MSNITTTIRQAVLDAAPEARSYSAVVDRVADSLAEFLDSRVQALTDIATERYSVERSEVEALLIEAGLMAEPEPVAAPQTASGLEAQVAEIGRQVSALMDAARRHLPGFRA